MQFFLANLYSERLSSVSVPATGPTTPPVAPVAPGAISVDDEARVTEGVLVGSH